MVSNSRSVPSSPKKLSHVQPAHRSPRKLNFVVPSSGNSCAISQSLDQREENNQLSCHSIVKRRRTTRRALFGRPQAADTNQWLSDLERSLMDEKVEKWGFDFRNDRPIDEPCSSSAVLPPSSMVYEPMEPIQVPHFYRSKTLCNESPKKGQRLPNLPQTFDKDHSHHHMKNEAGLRHNNGHTSREEVLSFGRLNHIQSPTKLRKLTSPVVHKTPGKKKEGPHLEQHVPKRFNPNIQRMIFDSQLRRMFGRVVAAASSAGPNAYTGQQQNVMFRKRMCFQCHQPFQCTKGFCYGDFCVKSLVAEKYVSKGCENRSSTNTVYSSRSASTKTNGNDGSPFYSSSSLRGEMDPTGCYQMDVFGVPNTICYCSDMDFCNGKKTLTISLLVNFSTLAIVLVMFV